MEYSKIFHLEQNIREDVVAVMLSLMKCRYNNQHVLCKLCSCARLESVYVVRQIEENVSSSLVLPHANWVLVQRRLITESDTDTETLGEFQTQIKWLGPEQGI
jgi:hypothetical protein